MSSFYLFLLDLCKSVTSLLVILLGLVVYLATDLDANPFFLRINVVVCTPALVRRVLASVLHKGGSYLYSLISFNSLNSLISSIFFDEFPWVA